MTGEAIEHTYRVPEKARLRLDNIRGSVEVKPGLPGEITVSAVIIEHSGDAGRTRVIMEQAEDGSVHVRTDYQQPWGMVKPCKVDYVATIPPGCELKVGCVSASISARGLEGDLNLSTVSGALLLENGRGKIFLHSVSGSVEAREIEGNLKMENVSGRVVLRNAQSASLEAKTVSGRMELETTLGDGPYRFNSVSGEVVLTIPAGTGCRVRLKSLSGRLKSYLPVTFQSKSNGRQEIEILGGGALIEFDSVSGGMRVLGPEGAYPDTNRAAEVEAPQAESGPSAQDILDRIERGEISVEEGINLLKS